MVTYWLAPSKMSNVLGSVYPPPLVQRNFDRIAAHFSLTLPHQVYGVGIDLDSDSAADAVQANFDAIATALSLDLFGVGSSADPEVTCQANFELINAAW